MKVAKEGLPFIIPFVVIALLFLVLGFWILFSLFFLKALFLCFFFRDPRRKIPQNEEFLISPADGKIVKIQTGESHPSFQSPVAIVSIFLSIFDVHITRSPLTGLVRDIYFKPGKFHPAYKDESCLENVSNSIFLEGNKVNILVKQIVGVVARRIKCFVKRNERLMRGQKMGMMYFGSRVDIFLPPEVQIKVNLNQKVKAGETIIGELKK